MEMTFPYVHSTPEYFTEFVGLERVLVVSEYAVERTYTRKDKQYEKPAKTSEKCT